MPQTYDVLRDILSDVNSWLHFAEAKNAAVVGANFAIAVALIAAMTTIDDGDPKWMACLVSAAGTLVVAGVWSLSSFLAMLKLEPPTAQIGSWPGNAFFFGDLAKVDADTFLQILRNRLGAAGNFTQVEQNLANQITVNSRIASQKFVRFNTALRITICGLLVPPAAGFLVQLPLVEAMLTHF
jgi:hypothetical protein